MQTAGATDTVRGVGGICTERKKKDSAADTAAAVHFAKIGSPFGSSFAVLRRGVAALSVLTAMPTPIPITAILREAGREGQSPDIN